MEKFRTALNKALELLAGLSMAVMVILTTYQVIARYIFNSPSTWSEELVGYLFGWSTLFGATIVSGERGHMNIPILVDRMNPGMRKAFHILWEVVAFLFSATILVFGGFQVSKLAMGQQTSSLGVAVGVFYWVMPICGVVILLYSILNIIGIANGNASKKAAACLRHSNTSSCPLAAAKFSAKPIEPSLIRANTAALTGSICLACSACSTNCGSIA